MMKEDFPETSPGSTPVSKSSGRPQGIPYLVGRLDRLLRRHITHTINPMGVTLGQYTALSVFSTRGQLSNAQLAERTMVSPQAANELMKVMERKGWIERQPDPNHGRIIQISLTGAGQALLAECDEAIAGLEAKMLEDLNETERQVLQKQLLGLVRVLSAF